MSYCDKYVLIIAGLCTKKEQLAIYHPRRTAVL